ncbi:hypothetical protein B9G69_017990 [Bdellovibrio sp. SKB1291214]|nr:hypothetical protein [Bdellovibrio sp. SKB1291214]UYL08931.1 hypothetical protein B9G69_017990 [Bdellovibrio sp. SKB1291214]
MSHILRLNFEEQVLHYKSVTPLKNEECVDRSGVHGEVVFI